MSVRAFWWIVFLVVGVAIVLGTFSSQLREMLFVDSGKELPQSLSWRMEPLGDDPQSGAPQMRVWLIADGVEYNAGSYPGSCHEIDPSSDQPLPYEKAYIVCWWAGGGYELGVFQEGNTYVLKRGELDEGSAETHGFRGNFVQLFEIK